MQTRAYIILKSLDNVREQIEFIEKLFLADLSFLEIAAYLAIVNSDRNKKRPEICDVVHIENACFFILSKICINIFKFLKIGSSTF